MFRKNFFPMPLLLMSAPHAASAWNLYDGAEFSREDNDFLAELHQYISHRATRAGWTAIPVYRRRLGDRDDDVVVVRFYSDPVCNNDRDWRLVEKHPFMPRMQHDGEENYFFCRQQLVKIAVKFSTATTTTAPENDPAAAVTATVVYMTRSNGESHGHYYVGLFRWMTRCADPRECVALFDAIASNIGALVSVAAQHESDRGVVFHLMRECLPLAQGGGDAVRVAAIERRVRMLQDDAVEFLKQLC